MVMYNTKIVNFSLNNTGTPFGIGWPTNSKYLTGVISVQYPEQLDFETAPNYYTLTVIATIRDSTVYSTTTVHINVTDVDDMPPRFNNNTGYVKFIREKTYSNNAVISLTAVDGDTGPSRSNDIKYGLVRVFPTTSLFHVANTTGQVYVNGNIDREKCANYLLLIKAYQADKPELRMDITTLNITVTDVDDNPPVLSQTHYNVRIPENTPTNVSVLTITATDADEGPNAEFHYHIKSEGNQGGFTIDPATGILRVNNGSMLDREMHPKWTLQVFAASILNNSIKSHDAEVIVDLLDENDNSPKFTSTFYIFTVNKTISISSTIGIVKANDTDKGDNGMVVYQLVGDESQRFNISDTGTIEAVKALDSNYEPWYRFTVIASDQAPEPNRRKTSVQVTVHVNDVNVNTPQFINIIKSISVQEDIQIGSEVLLLQVIKSIGQNYI
ncbi:protocadherin-9-like [Argopecten irradians]|uniref:protocadherin-9-like n=1 Tax=Argopecten irradians TaxID=31199 RepID=UPI0037205B5F